MVKRMKEELNLDTFDTTLEKINMEQFRDSMIEIAE